MLLPGHGNKSHLCRRPDRYARAIISRLMRCPTARCFPRTAEPNNIHGEPQAPLSLRGHKLVRGLSLSRFKRLKCLTGLPPSRLCGHTTIGICREPAKQAMANALQLGIMHLVQSNHPYLMPRSKTAQIMLTNLKSYLEFPLAILSPDDISEETEHKLLAFETGVFRP